MKENRVTIGFVAGAVLLTVLAIVTAPHPVPPDAFFDRGEPFFPDFNDPNAARTLEVIEYDSETGTAVPFKVTFDGKRWTIPSHYDYPADGRDRLAKTAAGLIGITKDDFRTDNPADYAACGVIDPLDESNPSLEGRGTRVTIKGENDVVLADLIIGNAVEGRDDFHLVRVPGQKRVYGTRLKLDLSTKFKDWIESDLVQLEQKEIDRVVIKDYSIDERTGRIHKRDEITLTKDGDTWDMDRVPAGKELERWKVSNLLRAIDELSIEGVRPKPAGLSASLRRAEGEQRITDADLLSLQSKGFYFTRDGVLVSNEGELVVHADDGVEWTLRFGEVATGDAGADDAASGENRYLMITASFDPSQFPEPEKPSNTDFEDKPDSLWTKEDWRNKGLQTAWEQWKHKVDAATERARRLSDRFADWYYVISNESFEKLHVRRDDLLRDKPGRSQAAPPTP